MELKLYINIAHVSFLQKAFPKDPQSTLKCSSDSERKAKMRVRVRMRVGVRMSVRVRIRVSVR